MCVWLYNLVKLTNKAVKLERLEKFQLLVADVYATWSNVLVVAGDFNISLLGNPELDKKYTSYLLIVTTRDHDDQKRQNTY